MHKADMHVLLTIKRHLISYGMERPQEFDVERALAFLDREDQPLSRKNPRGHITCSGWVVTEDFQRVLLIKHRALGHWMQPGGHMETEEWPPETAIREAQEETGAQGLQVHPPGLFDVDVHTIPENKIRGEAQHTHYDLRYLLVASNETVMMNKEECEDAQWFAVDDILKSRTTLPSVRRMAEKTKALTHTDE
jgi:8-oxo-dGTP pyrophosphatase MutT (NUDIX family)